MINYLCRRFLQIVPVLFLITLIVFCLVYVAGDPVSLMLPLDAPPEQFEALRSSLGLDRPLPVQYLSFLSRLARGDFGESFRYKQPALDIVLERIPATLELALVSMIFATIISIPMGIWSATRKDTVIDIFITGLSVLGKAMPGFWLGIMLILLFAVNTQIFPVSGRGTLMHLVLPALTLSVSLAAEMTRLTRSSIIEILSQDYIRTARSKGVNNFSVICKHAFKNCLIPLITIMAVQTSQLVGGALVIEAVFAWPGLGQLIVQAANARDMAILQAAVFIVALMVICINFLADILYTLVDPRVTLK
ncbi:MAG: ABC transporter permease [Dethiobacteria bacterium]|jgi:peptide/nickel transport system permease protein|nr:ABC transporter permease [Bacillota bacterium]HOB28944.1 ABC transporter permease [Bacillota bacterium]HPZ41508.1 ABC transporter permease [Bacillota bacterium]HQD52460.1 ABC transporter permease [Bacillota bacterium]